MSCTLAGQYIDMYISDMVDPKYLNAAASVTTHAELRDTFNAEFNGLEAL